MSTDFAKTTLEILKLAPRYLVSLGIVAALFLFLPDKTLKSFGVYDFVQSYRGYFFCVFVLTSVLFCVDRAIAFVAWIRHKILASEFAERRLKRLQRLTENEKQILRYYFAKQTRSNVLRIDDGVVNSLAADGVIFQSANVSGGPGLAFAHNIHEDVWNYILLNPQLLDGTTNTYRSDAWRF